MIENEKHSAQRSERLDSERSAQDHTLNPQAKAQLEHDIRAYAYAVEAGDVLAASINISNAIDALIQSALSRSTPQPKEEKDHGAELAAVGTDTGSSLTETASGWQPIIISAAPGEPVAAAPAWLYEPSCGVRLGSFGRFADGAAFGSVPGLNGCFVRDWGATHWQPASIPAAPEAK